MIIGLNKDLSLSCDKCNLGKSYRLPDEVIVPKTFLKNNYECDSCGNKLTYLDGIINSYCSEQIFSALDFVSDIVEYGTCNIVIGVPEKITLRERVPIFHKIFLSHQEKFFISAPVYENNQSNFTIISSELVKTAGEETNDEMIGKFGETVKIGWSIYGRNKEFKTEPWKQLLVQSKEEYLNEKYLLSYLSVAIALESYINSKIDEDLKSKKLDDKSIEIFLKESNMIDKIFILFKSLLEIDPMEVGGLSRSNFTKIIEKRNKIAHGKIIDVDKEEVRDVFRTVVKFILYVDTN